MTGEGLAGVTPIGWCCSGVFGLGLRCLGFRSVTNQFFGGSFRGFVERRFRETVIQTMPACLHRNSFVVAFDVVALHRR